MSDQSPEQQRRQALIAGLINDIRATKNAGGFIDRQTLIDAHPELMPELGAELDKLERVDRARRAAEAPPMPVDDQPDLSLASALMDEVQIPIQVPGYTMLRELSRGGQGVVFLAMQLSTGRKVAIKLMHEGIFASERALTRFRREVQSLAALNHPNIVAIIDTGKTPDGARFITMNYIPGMNLSDYMKDRHQKDPSDPGKLLRLFLKVCDAVNAAHRLGIIHRDLKPSNIRVDDRGEPHILDFGLARTALDHALPAENAVSVTGEFLGSLPWSSPEQAEGNPEKIDIRTDVYSLGVILYQILTGGRFPYDVVGNMRDVLNNILTAEPIPPSRVARLLQKMNDPDHALKPALPMVNEAMERIVLKALAKKPAQRYASAGELGRDVARYLAGQRTATPEPAARAPSTKRSLTGPFVIAGAVILLLAAGLLFTLNRKRPVPVADAARAAAAAATTLPAANATPSSSPTGTPPVPVPTDAVAAARQSITKIFGNAPQIDVAADGTLSVDQESEFPIPGTEGRALTLTGDLYMESHSPADPTPRPWVRGSGGVDLIARATDRLHGYGISGKAISSKRALVEGKMLEGLGQPLPLDQPDHQWLPFRFDVSTKALSAKVGDGSAELKGPLNTNGSNTLWLAPGAKVRNLRLEVRDDK